MSDGFRFMLAAGGTGGHVYPAIAIADALRRQHPDSEILFVGTRDRMEWKAVPAAGYDISAIWISGFHRRMTLRNLAFPLKLVVSLWQSRSLIRSFRPSALISCGGFAAGPVGWMAARMGIPVFLQEQNSYPGVTNRKLAPRAVEIYTAFEAASRWFPENKVVLTGNPLRKLPVMTAEQARKHFGFSARRPVLLVMGGSGGAKSINDAMVRHLQDLHDDDELQIIWQCGASYLTEISERIFGPDGTPSHYPNLRLYGFMDDMAQAWQAADLVVARAGAITCSELLVAGKAGILVPSPWVAGDHQTHNARALADQGAAFLLADRDLQDLLGDTIRKLVDDPDRCLSMQERARSLARPDAAEEIAGRILKHLEKQPAKKS